MISPSKITAIIDYAHTPDALENILKTLVSLKKGSEKIITVFGCGGDRDKGKRPLMGDISTIYSEHVLVTSDNPRSEDPKKIIQEICKGITPSKIKKVTIIEDRREAIKVAYEMANSGDIILIAGKGHEKYQIIGSEKIHFDDLEEIIEIFKKIQRIMLYHFFNFINNYIDFPGSGLFEFISFRAGMAVIRSLVITLIFGGKLIDYLHKKQVWWSL